MGSTCASRTTWASRAQSRRRWATGSSAAFQWPSARLLHMASLVTASHSHLLRSIFTTVLAPHALIKEAVALHVTIGHYKGSQTPSISTEIAELRRLLLGGLQKDTSNMVKADYFALAAHGKMPLIVNVWKADNMAILVKLKAEIEREPNSTAPMRMVFHGAQEAHLIAKEIAEANISVVISPPRGFPETWDERRALAGAPLSPRTAQNVLHNAGVRIALGVS